MKLSSIAIAAGIAAALAGCVAPRPEAYGPYPDNYKAIVAEEVRNDFFDPSSLQDVEISPPFQGTMIFTHGWVVCLRANGKNRLGAYAGRKEVGYLINNGQVLQTGDQISCPTAHYEPWPEMEMKAQQQQRR